MNLMIENVSIENFKGVKNLEVSFSEKTVISGQNGTGKSTIVDAIFFLLFNMDSHGNTKFEVRPLDANNQRIHHLDISVSAVFNVDGNRTELKKVQSEKWTKKRGHEERVFDGNVNKYEIDGYPKTEKEFTAYVSSVVDLNVFKMLCNPTFFTSMPWKDQRKELMNFVPELTDIELAQSNEEFSELIPEIEKAPSLDDIQKKYKKSEKELKAKQTEIPVRIDEASKDKVNYDVTELNNLKDGIIKQIAEVDRAMQGGNFKEEIDKLEQEKFELQFEINDRKRELLSNFESNKSEISNTLDLKKAEQNRLGDLIADKKSKLAECSSLLKVANERKISLADDYKAVNNEKGVFENTFDESQWVEPDKICPYCGQDLPKDRIEQLMLEYEDKKNAAKAKAEEELERQKKQFEDNKKNRLESITKIGFATKELIEKYAKEIEDLKTEIPDLESQLDAVSHEVTIHEAEFSKYDNKPDISDDGKLQRLLSRSDEIETQVKELKDTIPDTAELKQRKQELTEELSSITFQLAQVQNNGAIDNRIAELNAELKATGQKIANCERMIFLLEKFTKAKYERVSDAVNSHFKSVKFKLFDTLINGSVVECCEMMFGGVNYANLNSGHRVVGGLDIINALSELYGTKSPIFVDNAEGINDFNMPDMEQQMILLSVSDDKELVVKDMQADKM